MILERFDKLFRASDYFRHHLLRGPELRPAFRETAKFLIYHDFEFAPSPSMDEAGRPRMIVEAASYFGKIILTGVDEIEVTYRPKDGSGIDQQRGNVSFGPIVDALRRIGVTTRKGVWRQPG